MTSLVSEETQVRAENVLISEYELTVTLSDSESKSVPLSFYPRLVHASQQERDNWQIIGQGEGIRWPDLDEDISVKGIVAGRRSGESPKSFQRWLDAKKAGRRLTLYELRAHTELKTKD